MANHTHIEWTDATWNPLAGCSLVSPGCTNCYAMRDAHRLASNPSPKVSAKYAGTTRTVKGKPVWTGRVNLADDATLTQPLRWSRPRRIFVNSMSDLFHEDVPDQWIDRIFAVMALCPQHQFQVLTKRAARMREYLTDPRLEDRLQDAAFKIDGDRGATWCADIQIAGDKALPLPNVWLGVSAEDQTRADERIPELLETPAALRWISAEPLLGPIDWKHWLPTGRAATRPDGSQFVAQHFYMVKCERCGWIGSSELCGTDSFGDDADMYCARCEISISGEELPRLDWIVAGGESGPGARPMHPNWVRALRDQCAVSGVPLLFKQWGAWISIYDRDRDDPDWRNAPKPGDWDKKRWVNLAGGQGFHGDRLHMMENVGKKAAGRLLDGVEHNGYPEGRS